MSTRFLWLTFKNRIIDQAKDLYFIQDIRLIFSLVNYINRCDVYESTTNKCTKKRTFSLKIDWRGGIKKS